MVNYQVHFRLCLNYLQYYCVHYCVIQNCLYCIHQLYLFQYGETYHNGWVRLYNFAELKLGNSFRIVTISFLGRQGRG